MSVRAPGERDTPERDVRTSLIGPDQAQLDTLQDIALRRLEWRTLWFSAVCLVALGLSVYSVVVAHLHRHPANTPPARSCPVCPACECPDLSCPAPVCPQPVCPQPVITVLRTRGTR